MKIGLHQVNAAPENPQPGGVYFEAGTGKIKVAQEDGSYHEYGGGLPTGESTVVINVSALPTSSAYVPIPELVPALRALASGQAIPPVFVEMHDTSAGQLSFMAPAHFEVFNHTAPAFPQFYYRLEFTRMDGNNPSTLQGEMRRYVYAGAGTFNGTAVTLNRQTYHESRMPYLGGATGKVLTQRGEFVDLPVVPGTATPSADGLMSGEDKAKLDGIAEGANKTVVDAALSATSTNPLQNKAVKAALDAQAPITIPYASQASQYQPLSSTVRAALDAVLDAGGTRPVYFLSQDDGIFYPAAFNKSAAGEYKFNILDGNGDGRLIIVTFDSSGKRKSRILMQFTSSGDGTKFLNDAGQYAAIPQQERGTMVFFASGFAESVVNKGMQIPKSSLKPAGITPVVGKDIVIQVTVGAIGLITSSDLQNYYLSYDNGTLLQGFNS